MCMHSERDMTQSPKNTFINTTHKQQKESEAAAISVRRHIALGVLPVCSMRFTGTGRRVDFGLWPRPG